MIKIEEIENVANDIIEDYSSKFMQLSLKRDTALEMTIELQSYYDEVMKPKLITEIEAGITNEDEFYRKVGETFGPVIENIMKKRENEIVQNSQNIKDLGNDKIKLLAERESGKALEEALEAMAIDFIGKKNGSIDENSTTDIVQLFLKGKLSEEEKEVIVDKLDRKEVGFISYIQTTGEGQKKLQSIKKQFLMDRLLKFIEEKNNPTKSKSSGFEPK